MALQPSIILAGQPVNMLGALDASNQAAARQNEFRRTQDYRNMLAQNGAGILAGDQGALNALAGYDPQAALGVQNTRQSMAIMSAEEKRQAERYAASLPAEQAAAEAKVIEDGHKTMMAARSPQEWDALAAQIGQTNLVGQFGNREALALKYLGWADVLKQAFPGPVSGVNVAGALVNPQTGEVMYSAPEEPAAPLSSAGKLAADLAAGVITQEQFDAEMGKGGGVNVTVNSASEVGTIPQGYELFTDPATGSRSMRPIAGGPAAEEAAAGADKSMQRAEAVRASAEIVSGKIAQAKDLLAQSSIINPATGLGASWASGIGGSNAADMAAITDTISANIAFDELQAMREASPTGGALGAVTERELALLGSTLASLSQSQSPEQFAKHLDELDAIYKQVMQKFAAYPDAPAPAASGVPDGIDAADWEFMTPEERALFQ